MGERGAGGGREESRLGSRVPVSVVEYRWSSIGYRVSVSRRGPDRCFTPVGSWFAPLRDLLTRLRVFPAFARRFGQRFADFGQIVQGILASVAFSPRRRHVSGGREAVSRNREEKLRTTAPDRMKVRGNVAIFDVFPESASRNLPRRRLFSHRTTRVGARCGCFHTTPRNLAFVAVVFTRRRETWRSLRLFSHGGAKPGVRCGCFHTAARNLAFVAVVFARRARNLAFVAVVLAKLGGGGTG
jgi:hypothetical protein